MKSILSYLNDPYSVGNVFFHPGCVWEIVGQENDNLLYKVIWEKNHNSNTNRDLIRSCNRETINYYRKNYKIRPDL